MNEIRIGLAGLGHRGLYMLLLLQRIKGFRVVALCDAVEALHQKGLEALRDRDRVRLYTDYEKFLAHPEMDAVMLTVRCKEQGAIVNPKVAHGTMKIIVWPESNRERFVAGS